MSHTDLPSSLVCVATYNEIDNLPRLVERIFQFLPDTHLLVVDDNSPDGTGGWCDQQASADSRVKCIHRPTKLGLGTATRDGLQFAITKGYDRVLTMDADFSHDPRYLPQLLQGIDEYAVDVMIASRYIPGGGITGWPLHRRLMSRVVNASARRMLRLPVQDCSGAFRCYRRAILEKLDFAQVRSQGYSFFEEILWHLRRAGATFAEIPFVFTDRQQGQSKINFCEAVTAARIIAATSVRGWMDR